MNPETEDRLFYYCNDNETVEGPHAWEELLELLANGVISPATAICESGSEEWTTLGSYMLAEEQVLAVPSDDAAEFYEEAADPSAIQLPVPVLNKQRFRMTPIRWAGVALAAILLAVALVYTNHRAPASLESLLADAKTQPRTTKMNAAARERLDIDNHSMEWSMCGQHTGWLYFTTGWAFAPCSKNELQQLEPSDLKGEFVCSGESDKIRALFDPEMKRKRQNEPYSNAIPVRENQIILAKRIDTPTTIFALRLVDQVCTGGKEQVSAEYLTIPLDAEAVGISSLSHVSSEGPTTPKPANADEKPPVVVEMVLIGNPGNPPAICDNGEVGTVTYNYAISRYEITNEQYVAFLNSVAKDDKNCVFKENETSTKKWDYRSRLGPDGEDNSADIRSKSYILRTGEPGDYSYQVLRGFERYPVFGVTWLDAARFANWMHNGQPKGPQAKNTTEDGAYPLESSSNNGDIPRRPEAKFWLPNWNEWFKAAYYNPALPGPNKYNEYATGLDEDIVDARFQGLAVSNPGSNTVAKGRKAAVGSCGNKSAYGVADMVGNAQPEWTDEVWVGRKKYRGLARSGWDSSSNRSSIPFGLVDGRIYEAGIRLAAKPTAAAAVVETPPPTSTPQENPNEEIEKLKKQADNGDVSAQYQLGIKYRDGVGVAKDQAQAIHYLQKSAEAGNVWGQVSLAGMYARGALRDATKHFYWIEKAAHNGDQFAMLVAALCHADGIGTPKNADEADRLSSEVANKDPMKAVQAAAGVDWWVSALRKTGEPVSRARDLLSRSRADDTFQISVAGSQVMVNRMGRGPIGVVFFGHWRSREMKEGILSRAASFADLLPEKCSFLLWEYPKSAPFDRVHEAIQAYMQGDKENVHSDFSGVASQVLSQIREKTGLTEFLLVGNALGAGIVLWDYKNLSSDPRVKFLLISPTEAFMPPISSLGNLERTNFEIGHKIIGEDIDHDLLSKLIKVNLGLGDRAMLSEPLPVVATPLAMPVKFDIGREAGELPAGTEVQVLFRGRDKAFIQACVTNSGGVRYTLQHMVDSASLAPRGAAAKPAKP